MKSIVAVALALSTACATASTSGHSFDADSQEIASSALKIFVDSWNKAAAGNAEGPQLYGSLYWPDAELVDPSGNIWNGGPAIVQMHVDLWKTAFKGSVVSGVVRNTRRLSPTLMIVDFNLDLKVAGNLPPMIPASNGVVKAHLKHVMEKRGGDWKVVASQNTFYSDAQPTR
jgi:uncharacterized protein (TIGR02246 family)